MVNLDMADTVDGVALGTVLIFGLRETTFEYHGFLSDLDVAGWKGVS